MDLSEKGLTRSLSLAPATVLIFTCLCKGLLSQNSQYAQTVPATVSVQEGLCVHIPCSFTYDASDWRSSENQLLAYWVQKTKWDSFETRRSELPGILLATNDEEQKLQSKVVNRFQLTGDPREGDCSFRILSARFRDTGNYYFRIEGGRLKYSYRSNFDRDHTTLQVHVKEITEKPQILSSSVVLAGKEAVFTCSAPGPCSGTKPEIHWTSSLTGYKASLWSRQHTNGSWTYGSDFTFTPSLNDLGKSLTCRVWYPDIQKEVQNTILLDFANAPMTVEISTNSANLHKSRHLALCAQKTNGDSVSAVVQEGKSISLACKAQSRPAFTLSWTKGNRTLNGSKQGEAHTLLLSGVRTEDAGEYQCHAENVYGSARKTLQLCVLYAPRVSSDQSRSTCWKEANSLHCNCSLRSWPPPQIRWQVAGQTLRGNSTRGALQVTSKPQKEMVISSLSWAAGDLEESQSVLCLGSNYLGTYALHFLLMCPMLRENGTSHFPPESSS